jgi:hypothetical protein
LHFFFELGVFKKSRDNKYSIQQDTGKHPEYSAKQMGREQAEALEGRDRSSNIKLETGLPNTAVQLERVCTLWTKNILERYWI